MKLRFCVFVFLLSFFGLSAQNNFPRIYYDKQWKKTSKDSGVYYRETRKTKNIYEVKDRYINGKVQMEGTYTSIQPEVKEGLFRYYNETGKLVSEENYRNNKQEGVSKKYFEDGKQSALHNYVNGKWNGEQYDYYPEGTVLRKEDYLDGTFIKGRCYTRSGGDTTYYALNLVPSFPDQMPEFPGGEQAMMEYLRKNLIYPNAAEEKHIEGRVVLAFDVDKYGSISDVEIVKSANPLLDREAVNVIQHMPNWKPGRLNGVPVKVKYHLPIDFKLSEVKHH